MKLHVRFGFQIYFYFPGLFLHVSLKTVVYEKLADQRFQFVLGTAVTKSATSCCELCQVTSACDLVSYDRQNEACELHAFEVGDEIHIRNETGWDIYYSTGM